MKKTQQNTSLTPIETALQTQFKTDNDTVFKYLETAIRKRGQWLANAVMFGVLARKVQSEMKKDFSSWLNNICLRVGKTKRTGYNYIHLAKNLLLRIQRSKKGEPLSDALDLHCMMAKTSTEEIFKSEEKTLNMLEFVFSAMNESTLAEVLRESNADAYTSLKKESEENKKTQKELQEKDKDTNKGYHQLTFFDGLYEDTRASIETARADKRFLEMPREQIMQYGNYLMAQAREIIEIAKAKRD